MQTVYSQARDNNPLYSTGNNNQSNNNNNRPKQQPWWNKYLPEITRFGNVMSPAARFVGPSTEMVEATFNPSAYAEHQGVTPEMIQQKQQSNLQNMDEMNQIAQLSGAGENYFGNAHPMNQETQGILSDLTSNQPQEVTPQQEEEQPQQDTGGNTLPLTSPKPIEKSDKEFDQGNVDNATNFVGNIMQQNSPQGGMDLANHNSANTKLQSDIQKVAESKDPYKQWKNISNEPFYQDSSFYSGLMGVGLALMSGKSPLEAFQIGTGMSNQEDMKKQLAANRDLLIEQGYSPDSVVNAIAKGDASLLKEKPKKLEDQLALQDQYAQKKEQRAMDDWTAKNKITSAQQDKRSADALDREQARADIQLQKSKDLDDYKYNRKQQELRDKALSYDFSSRDLNAEKNTPDGKVVSNWTYKAKYFDVSQKDLDQSYQAIADYEKNPTEQSRQRATAAFKQTLFNLMRAEIGENRSLYGSDAHDFAEDPSVIIRTWNDIKLKSGFTPTLSSLNYLREQIKVGRNSANSMLSQTKVDRIKNVAKPLIAQLGEKEGKRKATALVNRAFGGTFTDPYGVFSESNSNEENSSGALTSANNSNSNWMYK